MEYFLYSIVLLLSGGLLSLIMPERFKGSIFAVTAVISSVFLLIPASFVLYSGLAMEKIITLAKPIGEVPVVLDRLSAFFAAIISIMSAICSIYASGYMKHYYGKKMTVGSHFFFLSVLMISMLLVVTVQNAVAFLISWELMSISSFFLVVFENGKDETFKAGLNYIVAMHIGVLFLISAFIILIINSWGVNFTDFREVFTTHRDIADIIFLLFFAGFGTKAGFIPFHTWLPKAHPAAPSHVSGLMSGVMIKTGIYGILRVISLSGMPTVRMSYFVLFISLFTAIVGISYAAAQGNIKKLLAYSSVENIGIIGTGIGAGMLGMTYDIPMLAVLGFSGAILHTLNHSIFKSMLFFAAGAVQHGAHTLEMEKLGGLSRTMKWTAVFFMAGSIAISGLPPFNGFISEFYIYWGILCGLQTNVQLTVSLIAALVLLALTGAVALLSFSKVFSTVFLGSRRSEYSEPPHDASIQMKTAMALQCLFIVAIVSAPSAVFNMVKNIATGSMTGLQVPESFTGYTSITGTLTSLTCGIFIFAALFTVIFTVRSILLRRKTASYKTWDCGYQAGTARVQYGSSSFAGSFINLVRPALHFREDIANPSGIFPEEGSYKSNTGDRFDIVISAAVKAIERFLNLFTWIQSGNIQQYIIYGIVFLIAISLWIIGA